MHARQAELTFGQLSAAALVYTTSVNPDIAVSFFLGKLAAAQDFLSARLLPPVLTLADDVHEEDLVTLPGVRKNGIAWSFCSESGVTLRKELELLGLSIKQSHVRPTN